MMQPSQTPAPYPVQQPPIQPGQQQVILLPSAPRSPVRENYAAVTSQALGIIQIVGGILAIICQAVLTGVGSFTMYSGVGFWGGIFFILAGTFGYCAGKHRTTCLIVTYMVLCIIAAVSTLVIFGFAGGALGTDKYELKWQHYEYYWDHDYPDYNQYNEFDIDATTTTTTSTARPEPDRTEWYNYWYSAMAFNIILILVGLVEGVTLILGSALACRATCCGKSTQNLMPVPTQYFNGQPCMLMDPGTSYAAPYAGMAQPPQAQAPAMETKATVPDSPPPQYRSEGQLNV